MSYISPAVEFHFKSLSQDLQNEILNQNMDINTLHDLIRCLEKITGNQ